MTEHRPLTQQEIQALEEGGCTCSDWQQVTVGDPFDSSRFQHVHFSGTVRVGTFEESFSRPGGISLPAGLYHCHIHNCTIEDNVRISHVQTLANYHVGTRSLLENNVSLVVDGKSRFGNGAMLDVLNEAGGRSLKIYDRLSSQVAYLLVLYRHRPQLIEQLETFIDSYAQSLESDTGTIGAHCTLLNCRTITNVAFSDWVTVSGATRLENGTIRSCQEDPTLVGDGVIAKDFMVLSGSTVKDDVQLAHCFVGQGVQIGKQFSAENSVFFANCEAFHGEACSIFAGPYTVSHHKSSLLIAGLYSFFNAGSGTNKSNHMYKLGPVHQGILERGSKTGSSSYLLWPNHIGAFTAVIGKHYSKLDTSNLPFSYIFDDKGKSLVLPSRNLLTAGTLRDGQKWPKRDRRKDPNKLDLIHFDMFSPYTVQKMVKAIQILRSLAEDESQKGDFIHYNGAEIIRSRIDYSCRNYNMAIDIFVGQCLVDQLDALGEDLSLPKVQDLFSAAGSSELYDWVDLSGLIAPASKVEQLLDDIEAGTVSGIEAVSERLKTLYDSYKSDCWQWCCALIEQRLQCSCSAIGKDEILRIINDWRTSSIALDEIMLKDSQKEFDPHSKIGYGVDGSDEDRDRDFESVRGTFESNSFVQSVQEHSAWIKQKAHDLIQRLESS